MMKKSILIGCFLLALTPMHAQNYLVNDPGLGLIGPAVGGAEGSIDQMIDLAINYANTGNVATITLDVDELLLIDRPLPIIDHTAGKIVLKNAGSGEGFKGVASAYWSGGNRYCIRANGGGVLEIDGLHFENFNSELSANQKVTIYVYNAKSVKIENCTFLDCGIPNYVRYQGGNHLNNSVDILNNTYTNSNFGIVFSLDKADGVQDDYLGDIVRINDNTLNETNEGIRVTVSNEDIYANFELKNNVLLNASAAANSTGIKLINPRKNHVLFSNNDITRFEKAIHCGNDENGFDSGNFGINFIEAGNSLLLASENADNEIVDCKIAFRLGSSSGNHFEYNIIAYSMDGSIIVNEDYASSLRENIIKKPSSWGISSLNPIDLILDNEVDGNNGIKEPIPVNLTYLGTTLNLEYSTIGLGLQEENGPFVVEVFEMDDENSVIQYLGNQGIPTSVGANYNFELTDAVLTLGNNIGLTITSLGTNVGAFKIGTSEFAYSSIELFSLPCEDCEKFSPTPGERYWASAWVRVDNDNPVKSYDNVSLDFIAFGGTTAVLTATPTGEIIDGWQRIVIDFTIPIGSEYFKVRLNADPDFDTYFDDIRIHPFNGSMKSYVYDGETFWLTSELDDNNYATFYEYDQEGGLIRIKKETSRGIVTIQETRSNTIKK